MDPRELGPKPPFSRQQQSHPGSTFKLSLPADQGETSYSGNSRLAGRVAINTGADCGIGRAMAIAFAKEGADIVLSYLPEEQADAAETYRAIENAGQKAIRLPRDIGSIEHAESLVNTAFGQFDRLDIVINNAAYQMSREKITEIAPDEFEHAFRTNVFGLFYPTRAALPRLKPGAVILNTTSVQNFEPSEELVPYPATKAAIANITKSLAKIASKQGVRVNAVAPGPAWTTLIPATLNEEKVSISEKTPFSRVLRNLSRSPKSLSF